MLVVCIFWYVYTLSFLNICFVFYFFFSSRRRHTRCALVTGVQTCALPIYQCFIVELRDRIPVDDIALPRREAFCLAFEPGALDAREPCRPLDLPPDLGLDLAKGGGDVALAVAAKARDAFEPEGEPPFAARLDVDDPPDPAHVINTRHPARPPPPHPARP